MTRIKYPTLAVCALLWTMMAGCGGAPADGPGTPTDGSGDGGGQTGTGNTIADLPDLSDDDPIGFGERGDATTPGLLIVGYDPSIDEIFLEQLAVSAASSMGGQILDIIPELNLVTFAVNPGTELAAADIASRLDRVQFIEFNPTATIAEATDLIPGPTAVEFAQYQLFRTGAITANSIFASGDMTIAVLDTGCDIAHTEFSGGAVVPGFNYIDGNGNIQDTISGGHGTSVISLISASLRSGTIAGLLPEATLTVHKVCGSDGLCPLDAVILGIMGALQGNADTDLATTEIAPADIILLPFSFANQYESLRRAIELAADRNVMLIAAAGNNGRSASGSSSRFPAGYEDVVAVGATDILDRDAPFSNRAGIDIAAPGVDLLVASPNSSYRYGNGTSYAAAQVAATAAWVWERDPSLNPDQVLARLVQRGDALPGTRFGSQARRLNIHAAVANTDIPIEPYLIRDELLVIATGVASGSLTAGQATQSSGPRVAEVFSEETLYWYGYFPRGITFELNDDGTITDISPDTVATSSLDLFLTFIRGIALGNVTTFFSVINEATFTMPELGGDRRAIEVVARFGEVRSDPRTVIYNPLRKGFNIIGYKNFESSVEHFREQEGDAFNPDLANIKLLGVGATPEVNWGVEGPVTRVQVGSSLSPDYLVIADADDPFTPPIRIGGCVGLEVAEQVCGEGIGLPANQIARIVLERSNPAGMEFAELQVIYVP